MTRTSANWLGITAVAALCIVSVAPAAQARDFFTALFGAFSDNPALAPAYPTPSQSESRSLPFASEGQSFTRHAVQPRPRVSVSTDGESGGAGGGQAYCVRTCDGRYFPI